MTRDVTIAAQLKEHRKNLCLTQKAAAEKAGVNYHSYVSAERGRMGNTVRLKVLRWLEKSTKRRSIA